VRKTVLFLALLTAAALAAEAADTDPAALRQQVRSWRQSHEKDIVRELTELVALRNVASDPADIQRNADLLVEMLRKRGFAARLLTVEGAPPAVYGELPAPPTGNRPLRTIVFYAHYDGQPAVASDWGGGDPWHAVLRTGQQGAPSTREVDLATASALDPEWRLYGRSASDDKGPIVEMLAALDALKAAGVPPGVRLKVFLEGEEEAGSPHLSEILAAYRGLLAADAWLLADGPVHPSRRMQVVFGARGVTGVEITAYGPARALHSGHYGNWAPNPAAMLVDLLAALRAPDGRIRIPGFGADVRPLTASARQWRPCPRSRRT
jgi:acetylornithine deacetylase/succinyl-diaminopimelate desuccinylase-like protein